MTAQTSIGEERDWRSHVCSWPDDAALTWTLAALEHARGDATIIAMVATGSAVRDVGRNDDLDLLLVHRSPALSLPRPPMSIDLQKYKQADVEARLAACHDYLSWAVRFGKVLFERDCWWTRLRAEWNHRLSLPSVHDARERARKSRHYFKEMSAAGDASAAADFELAMLTQLSRAELSSAGVFPKSRPEMAHQLVAVGKQELADRLLAAIENRTSGKDGLARG